MYKDLMKVICESISFWMKSKVSKNHKWNQYHSFHLISTNNDVKLHRNFPILFQSIFDVVKNIAPAVFGVIADAIVILTNSTRAPNSMTRQRASSSSSNVASNTSSHWRAYTVKRSSFGIPMACPLFPSAKLACPIADSISTHRTSQISFFALDSCFHHQKEWLMSRPPSLESRE